MAAPNLEMRLRGIYEKPPAAPLRVPLVVSFGLLPEEHRQGPPPGWPTPPTGRWTGAPRTPGPRPPGETPAGSGRPRRGTGRPAAPPRRASRSSSRKRRRHPAASYSCTGTRATPLGASRAWEKVTPTTPPGRDAVAAPGQKAPHPAKGVEEGTAGTRSAPNGPKGSFRRRQKSPTAPKAPSSPRKTRTPGEVPGGEQGGVLPQQGRSAASWGSWGSR